MARKSEEEDAVVQQELELFSKAPETGDGPGESDVAGGEGTGMASRVLMEQWLEQAEGAPGYLLRNQFRLEEQRELRQRGGLYEPRPW